MRTLIVAVSAVAVALAAGCSSGEPAPANESANQSSSNSARPAPVSTVPPKLAPVSAFAQVVAEFGPQLVQLADDAETDCSAASDSAACQDAYGMFGRRVDQFKVALLMVHSPSSASFLGAPPEEISSLVGDTEELASRASSMASAYELADCPDLVMSCVQERTYAQLSAGELVQKLAAWDAHI
jgi:hypothetical protein